MSHLLYRHRLFWDGRAGTLSLAGVYRRIIDPPEPFGDANYIDYAPEVRVAQIRRAHGPMRDMTPDETVQAERALLAAFVPAAEPPQPPGAAQH